jgi:hypothetical protein
MRLSLSLSIVAALLAMPLAACEFHAEAGHPRHPEPASAPAATTPPAATPAPAPKPTGPVVNTGHLHLTVPDAGT